MKSLSNTKKILLTLSILGLFVGTATVAHASAEDFCDTLQTTRKMIEQKKTERIDALRDVQARHENRFGESKKNFAVMAAAYQTRKVSPAFTESAKHAQEMKVQALQERLDRAQSFFNTERTGMNTVLARVTELEQEAFAEAQDACESGVPSPEVAETFKEDMSEIQSIVLAHGETMKKNKEAVGSLRERSPETSLRSKLFFFGSTRAK